MKCASLPRVFCLLLYISCWIIASQLINNYANEPLYPSPHRSPCASPWYLTLWRAWSTTTPTTGSSWVAVWCWDLWAGSHMWSLSYSRLMPASTDTLISSDRSGPWDLSRRVFCNGTIRSSYSFDLASMRVRRFRVVPWRGCACAWQRWSLCSCLFKEARSPTIFTVCCLSRYGTLSSKSE